MSPKSSTLLDRFMKIHNTSRRERENNNLILPTLLILLILLILLVLSKFYSHWKTEEPSYIQVPAVDGVPNRPQANLRILEPLLPFIQGQEPNFNTYEPTTSRNQQLAPAYTINLLPTQEGEPSFRAYEPSTAHNQQLVSAYTINPLPTQEGEQSFRTYKPSTVHNQQLVPAYTINPSPAQSRGCKIRYKSNPGIYTSQKQPGQRFQEILSDTSASRNQQALYAEQNLLGESSLQNPNQKKQLLVVKREIPQLKREPESSVKVEGGKRGQKRNLPRDIEKDAQQPKQKRKSSVDFRKEEVKQLDLKENSEEAQQPEQEQEQGKLVKKGVQGQKRKFSRDIEGGAQQPKQKRAKFGKEEVQQLDLKEDDQRVQQLELKDDIEEGGVSEGGLGEEDAAEAEVQAGTESAGVEGSAGAGTGEARTEKDKILGQSRSYSEFTNTWHN